MASSPPFANLATRCTACGTLFRVVPDQLRVSEGWVRCGRCAEVFNAAENLIDVDSGAPRRLPGLGAGKSAERRPARPSEPDPRSGWPRPEPPAASTPPTAFSAPPRAPTSPPYPAPGPSTAPPTGWPPDTSAFGRSRPPTPESEAPDTEPWAPNPMEAAAEAAARLAVLRAQATTARPAPAHWSDDLRPPPPARAPGWRDAPPPRADVDDRPPDSGLDTGPASRLDSGLNRGADHWGDSRLDPPWDGPAAAPPQAPTRAPSDPQDPAAWTDAAARDNQSPFAASDRLGNGPGHDTGHDPNPYDDPRFQAGAAPAPLRGAPAGPDEQATSTLAPGSTPSFLRKAERAERWRRPQVRAALGAVAGLAALSLLAQVALTYRDLMAARFPASRPWLVQACQGLGCTVEPPRAIQSLVVESSGLVRVERSNIYRLQVGLRNAAGIDLALPALDLSLTDSQGRLIARRVLRAEEMLAHNATPGAPATLGSGRELALQATLQATGEPIAGYTIELFYP